MHESAVAVEKVEKMVMAVGNENRGVEIKEGKEELSGTTKPSLPRTRGSAEM